MLTLQIVSVSRRAQDPLTASADLYLKRLQQLGPATLQRYKRPEECSKLRTEAQYLILLCPTGELLTSAAIARRLGAWQQAGKRRVVFALGAADGHLPEQSCHERWSFGPITLPHRLALVVLLEQLYRARTILAGHKYHRGSASEQTGMRPSFN